MRLTRRTLGVLAAGAAAAACAPSTPQVRTIARLGIGLEPPTLDPTAGAAAATDEVVYANVFEGLTRIGPDGLVAPGLARRWDRSADGREYLFELHPGVTFHDGAPCTSAEVAFSLMRAKAPDSTNAQKQLFEPIVAVEPLDPLRVRVRLSRPVGDFLFSLAWGDAVIVAPATADTNATAPVGTGPFRFARWARGALIELVRNDLYWGPPAALTGARFTIIPDAAAAFAALMADDVDGFPDFPAPELLPQIARDPRFRIAVGASQGETILAMNNTRAPFSDIRVRRALSHAVDRQAIINGAMFGSGTPIGSHVAPTDPAYLDLTGLYPHDPARARALLAEAGYPDGFEASLRLPPTAYARRGGEIVAAQLRAVGLRCRIENVEWAQWLEQVFTNRDFDLTIVSHTEPADYGIYARDDYYFGYASADFKALMAELDRTLDPQARTALLHAIQRRIADDAVNVFLFQFPKLGVWRRELVGVWTDAHVQANDLTAARWATA